MNRAPRISAIGVASMDMVVLADRYPSEGEGARIETLEWRPGGTTLNSAIVAARLGASVRLIGRVGDDQAGEEVRTALIQEGIDVSALHTDAAYPTSERITVYSALTGEQTIFRKPGARIVKGARIAIDPLFSSDIVVVDVDDVALYRFLVDLPVHTFPNARLLGTMHSLAQIPDVSLCDVLPRLDSVVGTADAAIAITGAPSLSEAITAIQGVVAGTNLRFAAIDADKLGVYGVTTTQVLHVAPASIPTLGAIGHIDAITGALAFSLASRWNAVDTLMISCVAAGLSAIPSGAIGGPLRMADVRRKLDANPPQVTEIR